MHISHHAYNKTQLVDRYKEQLESIQNSLEIFDKGKYFVVRDMYNKTLSAACCSVLLDKSAEEIRNNFYLFLDVAIAKFLMGTHVGEEITFSFRGKEYTYVPEPKNYTLSDQGWISAFFVALLFQDIQKVRALNEIDMEKVLAASKTKGGTHTVAFAHFLSHVFKGDENNLENLKKVSDLLKPESMPAEIFPFVEAVTGGQVDLFGAALIKESAYFNEVFPKVVSWHKRFYAANNPDSEEGLFAFELTAICKLARRYGVEFEHSSDYTPARFWSPQ